MFYLAGIWRLPTGDWPASHAVLTVAANPEVARYEGCQGALILRDRHMHWLELSVPEAERLMTPAARTFLVEEISERGLVQPALTL